jgi:hypothetical protein
MVAITVAESEHSTVSWAAVIAGGITAAALSLFLLALGMGLGLSAISPWSNEGVSTTTFQVGAGIYIVCVAMLASAVGGFLAGRLRHTWTGVHSDEVYFRDTAHGLLAWAFATVLGATVLGAAATHIVAGTASGLAPAAASVSNSSTSPTDIYVDNLLRTDQAPGAPAGGAPPAGDTRVSGTSSNLTETRSEFGRLMAPTLRKGGDLSATDRAYVAKIVAARTGLSQPEAEKRVAETITQAKKAADDARKATAKLMLWLAGSLLAGALASMLGATEGGVFRDSRWHEPGWRARDVRNH